MFTSTSNVRKAVGDYILDEPLFMDSFSSTYQAFHVNTSQEALVRIIETSTLSMIDNSYQLMQDEIKLLQQFSHPNIIKLITLFSTRNNCYIIYEPCSGGSFETYVKMNRFIPENEAIKLLHEILNGYGELHKHNIPLKSIRLDSFVIQNKVIKLFDISLVKNFEKFKKETFLKTNIKFWFSIAPEIYFGASQTNRCDIWSLGIIFYQMLFGELPWRSDNIEEFFKAATTQAPNLANKFQKISKPTLNALLKMLQPDPNRRVSYEELCKDPLFLNFYDRLQEREQKIVQKIRMKPDCWQAASMMYTADPLISIFDLGDSIKSSTSNKSGVRKSVSKVLQRKFDQNVGLVGPDGHIMNSRIEEHPQKMQEEPQNGLTAFELLKAEIKNLASQASIKPQPSNPYQPPVDMNPNPHSYQVNHSMPNLRVEPSLISASNLFPLTSPDTSQKIQKVSLVHEKRVEPLHQMTTQENSLLTQSQNRPPLEQMANLFHSEKTEPKPQKIQTDLPSNLIAEFRKYTSRINFVCNFLQLYSQAASSAAKLFKTEFIIFECFFLYKKLLKCLRLMFDALAGGENVFRFEYWKEYLNSPHFFNAVETVELNLDSVEDIFEKIYKECRNKLDDPLLKIDRFRDYITDDLEDIDSHLNSFLTPYLEKFLPSEENISNQERALLIRKHKIEIINSLLLNKMPETNPEDAIVSLKDHKVVMKTVDEKMVQEYFVQQYKKFDLFKFSNLKNII